MNLDLLIACGVVWHETKDVAAAVELVRALRSGNPEFRLIARIFLYSVESELEHVCEIAVKITSEQPQKCLRFRPIDAFLLNPN
jgi:hypothetical protein